MNKMSLATLMQDYELETCLSVDSKSIRKIPRFSLWFVSINDTLSQ